MKKNSSFYLLHLCLCLAFMLLPYAFTSSGSIFSLPNLASNGHDRIYFLIYFLLLLFFYFNYYYLIPKVYFSKKLLLYFTIIVLFLLFFLWISTFLDHPERNFLDFGHGNPPKGGMPRPKPMDLRSIGGPPTQYGHTALVYLIGVVSSLLFAINIRLQKVEKDKMKSELSFLKAQINPHFLFNTLNSIYSLAIKKDDKTADAVVQLSELMRYIITNANDDVIALDKEINYINNFVQLQKTRLGNTVKVDYVVEGNAFGKCITPLILISFIENAFKHGVNPNQNSDIVIRITIVGDYLTLFVSNYKVQSIQSDSGIGLQNTIERLSLLYPNNHVLKIDDNQENYTVILTIKVG
ncbi:sensor histidine kinase [Flavobacterium sp. LT1R49]|uniref:sensor histidine kinase n=1 Tax=Flavobacterium arabinosi TaxID=3398737 RepID=UPI003A88C234